MENVIYKLEESRPSEVYSDPQIETKIDAPIGESKSDPMAGEEIK